MRPLVSLQPTHPTWTYLIISLLNNQGEVFGYLERGRAHSDPTALDSWLLQNMLLLVAPPLLAATLYTSYGRVAT